MNYVLLSYTDVLVADPLVDPHCADLLGLAEMLGPQAKLWEVDYGPQVVSHLNLSSSRCKHKCHIDYVSQIAGAFVLKSSRELYKHLDADGDIPTQAKLTLAALEARPELPIYVVAQDPRPELMMPWYTLFRPYRHRFRWVIPALAAEHSILRGRLLLDFCRGQYEALPEVGPTEKLFSAVFAAARLDQERIAQLRLYLPGDAYGWGKTQPVLDSLTGNKYSTDYAELCKAQAQSHYSLVLYTEYHDRLQYLFTDRFWQAIKYSVAIFPDRCQWALRALIQLTKDQTWAEQFIANGEELPEAEQCIKRQKALVELLYANNF